MVRSPGVHRLAAALTSSAADWQPRRSRVRAWGHDGAGGRTAGHGATHSDLGRSDGAGRCHGAAGAGPGRRDWRGLDDRGIASSTACRSVRRSRTSSCSRSSASSAASLFERCAPGSVSSIATRPMRCWCMPTYVALATLNLGLVTVYHPGVRARILRDTGLPSLPLELLSGLMAAADGAGLGACRPGRRRGAADRARHHDPARALIGDALMSGDDLVPSSTCPTSAPPRWRGCRRDRERLLSEVLDAEQRERARLAESLHDGPMQRLVALRQDAAEADDEAARQLAAVDAAIAETRAIISSFHPATVRELGFEASLRAAVAPVPRRPVGRPDDPQRRRRPRRWRAPCCSRSPRSWS